MLTLIVNIKKKILLSKQLQCFLNINLAKSVKYSLQSIF